MSLFIMVSLPSGTEQVECLERTRWISDQPRARHCISSSGRGRLCSRQGEFVGITD